MSDLGLIPVFLAKSPLRKSQLPPECALGTRASSCVESLRAALGTEFPVASKGGRSQLSSQGARTAGKAGLAPAAADSAPLSDVRSVRRLWSQASADGTGAARSQALLGTVLAFPGFVNAEEAPQKPHAEQSLRGAAWKARGLERGRGDGGAGGASSGAWELLLASPEMSAPPGCLGTSHCTSSTRQQVTMYRERACQPGVPARCAGQVCSRCAEHPRACSPNHPPSSPSPG